MKDIDRNDYLALTTLYIQVFNPARASIAEKYLSKYKGREAEMFAELSSKWLAINPLEKSKEEQPNKPQNLFASTPSQPTTTTSASSPFAAPFKTEEKKSDTTSPFAAPFTSKPTLNIASKPAADAAPSKDYHKLLTEFYQKHNSQKLPEVAKTLEKYKVRKKTQIHSEHGIYFERTHPYIILSSQGKEVEMFTKLATKYKTSNPLDSEAAPSSGPSSFGLGDLSSSLGVSTSKSPFGTTIGGDNKSPFSVSGGASASTSASSVTGPTSNTTASVFGGAATVEANNNSPFGTASSTAVPTKSPFSSSSSAFGGSTFSSSPSPFGGAPPAPAAAPFSSRSAFGSTTSTTSSSTFGQVPAQPTVKFGGRNPRDILSSFYQTHNPSKVGEVDKLLTKYVGREEQLFLNLAKKYNLDPSQFGVSAQPVAAPSTSTGAATFGSPAGNTGFGASNTGFGTTAGSSNTGFGGFASAPSGGGFGSIASASAGSGFGGFGTSGGGFASTQQTPFGGARR